MNVNAIALAPPRLRRPTGGLKTEAPSCYKTGTTAILALERTSVECLFITLTTISCTHTNTAQEPHKRRCPSRRGGERPAPHTGAGAAFSRRRCSCPFPLGRPAACPPYRDGRTETKCSCPSLQGRRAARPPYRAGRTTILQRWWRRASKSPWGVGVRGVEGVRTYTLGVIWRN